MRKIAAHYWLRPDGSIGKFPIISFDAAGRISEIRERDQFVEEPFLELTNGLLIPGLIDSFNPSIFVDNDADLRKILNRYLIQGVKVLGLSKTLYELFNKIQNDQLLLHVTKKTLKDQSGSIGFKKIQDADESLSELVKMTTVNAEKLSIENRFGKLNIGTSPGIISISNFDNISFNMHSQSKIKIII